MTLSSSGLWQVHIGSRADLRGISRYFVTLKQGFLARSFSKPPQAFFRTTQNSWNGVNALSPTPRTSNDLFTCYVSYQLITLSLCIGKSASIGNIPLILKSNDEMFQRAKNASKTNFIYDEPLSFLCISFIFRIRLRFS